MTFRVVDPEYESRALAEIKRQLLPRWSISYDVSLPLLVNLEYPEGEPLPCHEPIDETTAISCHISARIHAFYKQLAAAYAGHANPEALGRIRVVLGMLPQSFDRLPFCSHRRYHSRRLQLHDPETLLDLPFVSSLTVQSKPNYGGEWEADGVRPLSPLVPLQCLVRLPEVEELRIPWMWERPVPGSMTSRVMREHYTRPWEGPLRDARHEFGAAVIDPAKYLGRRIPTSLTKAALYFWEPEQVAHHNQDAPRPNLIYPAYEDPVSLGLCKLAAQLEILDVRALITKDMFPNPEVAAPWSKMRRLRIEFHPLRPDGRWYFIGPRGEDPHDSEEGGFKISDSHYPRDYDIEEDGELDEEWEDDPLGGTDWDDDPDLFRTEPCRERIEPLLKAFAEALTNSMPNLEVAEMYAALWWTPSFRRAVEYGVGPEEAIETKIHRWGVKYSAGEKGGDATAPTVQWQVGDWRPSQDVMSIFESLGQQEWLDLEFTDGRKRGGLNGSLDGSSLF